MRLIEPEQLEFMNVDPPKPTEAEVPIEVNRVGICGTNVKLFKGTMPYFNLGWAPDGTAFRRGDRHHRWRPRAPHHNEPARPEAGQAAQGPMNDLSAMANRSDSPCD